ncbi:Aldo/keto reductase [Laetiporus sulphureus 93-53]|uniref:Aldo/keto reductase n=1 Tax=Laetiporus sulphureus 93-53 TaxID=1314785 RepID=A0A165B6R4_9APHY|nr:Aldo/keto reductase [Laetiporus sulphureus 93-53]KZT00369.1 Aldo/keto reductase [Laetiporus sulphureus 93-53]
MSDIPALPSKKVPYAVRLGKSGLKDSRVILGCMTYGDKWTNWLLGEEEAIKHIKFAYDAGIQTFDTAGVCWMAHGDIILGKAIKQLQLPREEIIPMIKFGGVVSRKPGEIVYDPPSAEAECRYVNQWGASRKACHIFDAVKKSLERLQLDYIDVLQLHRIGDSTPFEETMHALHDVVKAGYVRYIGISSCWAWQFHAMQNYAITHNLTPFISMQDHHNLIYREEEREMFPSLKHFGVSAIPYSPLGGGLLCRPLNKHNTKRSETDQFLKAYKDNPHLEEIINRVEEVVRKRGVSMAQVTVAWSLSKDVVAAPIVGTTKLEDLEDILEGVHLTLTSEEIKYLEEPYRPMKIIGHH